MKQHKALALVVVTLILLSLLPVQAVAAEATFTTCEGVLIPLGVLNPGTWTYPGGNTHVRGMVGMYKQYMPNSDPRCSGLTTSVRNANLDAYGVGPSWGTFQMVLEEGSSDGWEGSWTGMSYADGTISIRVVGHGFGNLEGQHVFVDIAFPAMFEPGVASGYILDPGGE
ncbi:MAG: hypothetical protein GWN58_48935 [Anaerolineae bacterium]|nr:hypothetical protein [Anaerolineae bacterium]